ncbi:hypothetical protein Sste5346_006330 [Sporothrix stenoceras]|uniref:Zn(2)-C6 fungal-type domain-containing protein n=1 Tax=Sporothrix stenoceras TaxID=5173 RepID=A0ABR3YZZ0_9PEZI
MTLSTEQPPENVRAESVDAERPRKRRRARTGCLTCRARRVKCDETHPQCGNCANRYVECTWADASSTSGQQAGQSMTGTIMTTNTTSLPPTPTPTPTTPSPPPTPAATAGTTTAPASAVRTLACLRCRGARSKCSQTRPTCARCASRGYACQYPERKGSLTPAAQSWIRRVQGRDVEDGNEVRSDEPTINANGAQLRNHHSPDNAVRDRNGLPATHHENDPHNHDSTYDDIQDCLPHSFPRPTTNSTSAVLLSIEPSSQPDRQGQSRSAQSSDGRGTTPDTQSLSTVRLPCQDRIERLAIAFFLHVHVYRANGFFERDKTLAAVRERRLAKPLLLGLCAVGSRFAGASSNLRQNGQPEGRGGSTDGPNMANENREAIARSWAAEAGRLVMRSTEVSRENVEAALLLTIYSQQAGRFAQSHLWAGIAMQQAVSLGLHREISSPSSASGRGVSKTFTEGERDRRLFFACYSMNRFLSNGAPESIQCPAARIRLRLPCDGFNFRMGLAVETPYALLETGGDTSPQMPGWMFKNVGAMGFWIRLVGIRAMVKQYFYGMMEARRVAAEQDHEDADDWVSSMDAPGGTSLLPSMGMPQPAAQQTQAQPAHHHATSSSSAFSPSALTATSSTSPNAPPSYIAPWVPDSPFVTCLAKLAALRESLPLRLQLGRALRTRPHDWPALGQIVLFYLWWNECHIELCSIALPGYPQSLDAETLVAAPDGWVAQTRQSCLRHAQAITDTLALVDRELPPNGPRGSLILYDHTIAHAVYLSLRVQLEHWQTNEINLNDGSTNNINSIANIADGDRDDTTPVALKERLEKMLQFVENTSVYFHSVHLVLREMRRMMSRHGLSSHPYPENESRDETPPPPWFQHQKNLDSRSLADRADMDAVNLEAILLELLPDCNAHTSWVRAYEYDANAAYLPVNHVASHTPTQTGHNVHTNHQVAALQTPAWDPVSVQVPGHVPSLWMGQDAHTHAVGTAVVNPITGSSGDPNLTRSQMAAFGVLNSWDRVGEPPRLDSLLPN